MSSSGQWRLDASLSYSNEERQGVQTSEPIIVQTGETSFITIPTKIGERRINADVLVSTFGLRYGLTSKAEIYTRASYLYQNIRLSDLSGNHSQSEDYLADAWAGINYQFLQDAETPALIGYWEAALYEKHKSDSASAKSSLFGATIYRAIDPVVIAANVAYQWNMKRNNGDVSFQPGNYFLLSPSVAFAVNDRVTLISGFQWINRHADRYDGRSQGYRRTSTDVTLGFGYGVSKGNTVNISFKADTSGQGGADLRFGWLYAI